MNALWEIWLVVCGLVIGAVAAAVLLARLPRAEDDVDPAERPAEATWIAAIIERYGGVAPAELVEEVLDLHQVYLSEPRAGRPPRTPPARRAAPPPGSSRPPGAPPPGRPRPVAGPPAAPPLHPGAPGSGPQAHPVDPGRPPR